MRPLLTYTPAQRYAARTGHALAPGAAHASIPDILLHPEQYLSDVGDTAHATRLAARRQAIAAPGRRWWAFERSATAAACPGIFAYDRETCDDIAATISTAPGLHGLDLRSAIKRERCPLIPLFVIPAPDLPSAIDTARRAAPHAQGRMLLLELCPNPQPSAPRKRPAARNAVPRNTCPTTGTTSPQKIGPAESVAAQCGTSLPPDAFTAPAPPTPAEWLRSRLLYLLSTHGQQRSYTALAHAVARSYDEVRSVLHTLTNEGLTVAGPLSGYYRKVN